MWVLFSSICLREREESQCGAKTAGLSAASGNCLAEASMLFFRAIETLISAISVDVIARVCALLFAVMPPVTYL